jgi:hypothetical protein
MATPVTPIRLAEVSLDDLRQDPSRAADLPPHARRAVVLVCSAIISACAVGSDPVDGRPAGGSTEAVDDWLTPDQAAHLLKKPRHWLVRHHRELPFARKVSRKTVLFNRTGALRWLETRPR